MRATDASLADVRERRCDLTGALDLVEVDARAAPDGTPAEDEPTRRRRARAIRAALARRARRSARRAPVPAARRRLRTTCTSWSSAGRGIFLRAAPIDVSAIVRELLLDRMRTTVLTSATLTVDGTFDYIRERLGITDGRRSPAAVGVRLRAAGDPVPAAAHAGSAVARVRDGRRAARSSRS